MERIVSEMDQQEFVQNALGFVAKKEWTISNLSDAFLEIVEHMEKNATLKELTNSDSSAPTKN